MAAPFTQKLLPTILGLRFKSYVVNPPNSISVKTLKFCGISHNQSQCVSPFGRLSSYSTSAGRSNTELPDCDSHTKSKSRPTSTINNIAQERLSRLMQTYEDFVGLTEVKEAQNKVVTAEQNFLQVQEDRRSLQAELISVQSDVRAVGAELEKTSRTDSRYIDLVKREHEVLLVEKDMSTKVKLLDKAERDFFALLSASLRESHEKERAQAEKTKYWSIFGSIIGAVIGIIGSTVNNMRRMKELRAIVTNSAESVEQYKLLTTKALESVEEQNSKFEEYRRLIESNVDLLCDGESQNKALLYASRHDFEKQTQNIIQGLQEQSISFTRKLQDISNIIGLDRAKDGTDHVVYAGPQIESLLSKSEENLKNDIRKNSWVLSIAFSSIITVGVGILAFIIRANS